MIGSAVAKPKKRTFKSLAMRNFGAYITTACMLLSSLMGTAQWTDISPGIPGDLNGVWFTSDLYGYTVGTTGIYHTTDGGAIWNRVDVTSSTPDSIDYENTSFNCVFEDGGYWYAAGTETVSGDAIIFVGQTFTDWSMSYKTNNTTAFNGLGTMWIGIGAAGNNGIVRMSDDDGATWTDVPTAETADLYTIDNNGSEVYIGGENVVLRNPNITSSVFSDIEWFTMNDLHMAGSTVYSINYNSINIGSFSGWTTNTNYPGILDATCLDHGGSGQWIIGSDDGVFVSQNTGPIYWEFQPSSDNYSLNDVHADWSGVAYGVGDGGLIIKSMDFAQGSTPYFDVAGPYGGCVDTLLTFTVDGEPGHSYIWKVDGTPVSNAMAYDTAFATAGTYVLTLVVDNGTLADSLVRNLTVVELPDVSLNYTIEDTLLCKIGESDITVHLSEADVMYTLIRLPDMVVIDTETGNGADAIMNTGTITDSTYYLIQASNINADCEHYFLDTLLVGVEKTRANFTPGFINAETNELTTFFNNSIQAATFDWDFVTGSPLTSTLPEPKVSFTNLGITSGIRLIATSQYGCIDTVYKDGPNVFDAAAAYDEMWALNHFTTDNWNWGNSITTDDDGNIYSVGECGDCDYKTKHGVQVSPTISGGYIAMHDKNGVLKWLALTKAGYAEEIEIDSEGNLVISHENNGYIATPDGDSTQLYGRGMVKLDTNGNFIWNVRMSTLYDNKIGLDPLDNVYLTAKVNGSTLDITTASGNVFNLAEPPGGGLTSCLTKFTKNGELIWNTFMFAPDYDFTPNDLAVDLEGKATIVGNYSGDLDLHHVGGGMTTLIHPGGGQDPVIIKYDSSGVSDWAHGMPSASPSIKAYRVDTDRNGNSYTLFTEMSQSFFPSTSGGMDSLDSDSYALVSYDPDGNYRWSSGYINQWMNSNHTAINQLYCDERGYVYTAGWNLCADTSYFTSTDNQQVWDLTTPNEGPLFFLQYDTNGVIQQLAYEAGLGLASPNIAGESRVLDLTVDNDRNLIFSGALRLFIGQTQGFLMAGDTLHTEDTSPTLVKLGASMGLYSDSIVVYGSGIYCAGSSIDVPFFVPSTVSFNPGNKFYLELSDVTGSFATPVVLDSLITTNSADTITGIIPGSTIAGNYKVRITTSDPVVIGNERAIQVIDLPAGIVQVDSICEGNSVLLTSTFGSNYAWTPTLGLTDPTIQTPTASPTATTTYAVSVDHLCGAVIDTFHVEVLTTSASTISDTTICDGDTIQLLSNIEHSPVWQPGVNISNQTVESPLVWPDVDMFYAVQSIYNPYGCRAYDTVWIYLAPSYLINENVTGCGPFYTFPDGTTSTVDVTHVSYLQSSIGCDSTIVSTLDITIIDTAISESAGILNAVIQPGMSYQWYNCTTGDQVVGSTGSSFNPTSSGSYAAILTMNGCVDTTTCITVTGIGSNHLEQTGFEFYPNPVNDRLNIVSPFEGGEKIIYQLFNSIGQLVYEEESSDQFLEIPTINLEHGTYVLQVSWNEEVGYFKVTK